MNLSHLIPNATKFVKSNSPEILTALSVSGVVATTYLTAKATFKAAHKLSEESPHLSNKERAKIIWRFYVPAGISGTLTIGCIFGASRINSRRAAAAVTAYSLTEKAFSEYREHVVNEIGAGKEETIRNKVAQDRVLTNPNSKEVMVIGSGHVLCCELFTNRYFRSDMETLRKAMNDINEKIIHEPYVTLDEFYDRIGLPYTSVSNGLGWDSDKLLVLEFSTVLSKDGEPCLAFDYNYTKPLK